MSKVRQMADQNWEEGAAQRRDWNPDPGSAHYRVYKYWMRKSGKRPERENFCHYWRVVLIWGPLRWLVTPLLVLLVLAVFAALVAVTVMFTNKVLGVVVVVSTCAYIFYGWFVGKQLLHDLESELIGEIDEVEWLDDKSDTIKSLAVLSALPVLIVLGILGGVFFTLLAVLFNIYEDYDGYNKAWRWFTGARPGSSKWLAWLRPWLIVPAGVLIPGILINQLHRVLLAGLIIIGVICVGGGALLLVAYLVDTAKERAKERRAEARRIATKLAIDGVISILFEVLHSEQVGQPNRFEAWQTRYMRYCQKRWNGVYTMSVYDHFDALESVKREQLAMQILRQRITAAQAEMLDFIMTRQPSRLEIKLEAAFDAVCDYLSLIWSVVLTRKWKICPWVELPS